MVRSTLPAFLLCGLLVGCGEPAAESSSTGDSAATATDSSNATASSAPTVNAPGEIADATNGGDATSPADAAAGDDSPWLPAPAGLTGRVVEGYNQMRVMAAAEDPTSMANLGYMSHEIARAVAEEGSSEKAYPYLKQAGSAMRTAMEGGVEGVPEDLLAQVFYFESVALALDGQVQASVRSLDDAINNGFTELDILMHDDDMAAVRESQEFTDKLADWKAAIAAREAFPFSFSLTDINGNEVSLEALKGKVVIVDFWGTWCPPCRAEIPSFIKLQEEFGESGFQMIGLNYERNGSEEANLKAVVDFVAETGINYPCILADDATRAQVPDFGGYPTTLFIDKTGQVRKKAVGLHDYEYLEAIVSELLAEEV